MVNSKIKKGRRGGEQENVCRKQGLRYLSKNKDKKINTEFTVPQSNQVSREKAQYGHKCDVQWHAYILLSNKSFNQ